MVRRIRVGWRGYIDDLDNAWLMAVWDVAEKPTRRREVRAQGWSTRDGDAAARAAAVGGNLEDCRAATSARAMPLPRFSGVGSGTALAADVARPLPRRVAYTIV